jgi:predicted alpha/beta-fold hydrolase
VGYSLGGNMLLKLQAEYAEDSPLTAAISVCAPILLDVCADRIDKGFSRLYQRHLMNRLVRNLLRKYETHDFEQLINLPKKKARSLQTFWQFDNAFTGPVHGFGSAENYYKINSARQYLKKIKKPTLMIQAFDDPFMTAAVIPKMHELGEGVTLEISRYGGHVGFVAGSVLKPRYWLPERICEYLQAHIKTVK